MPSSSIHPGVRIEKAHVERTNIVTERTPEELFEMIDGGQLILFKELWPREELTALRNEILAWARNTEVWPQGVSASVPGINFHRIDDGTIGGRLPHIFHQFGFGDFDALPESLHSIMVPIAETMCNKMNEIAGTNLQLNGGETRIKVMRHPRGGGHLVWHRHPYLPQKVELFLNLSQPGIDYHSGGADFKTRAGTIETCDCYEMGDIIAWRYDLSHRTQPIDPNEEVNWDHDDGFWLLAVEMTTSHGRSNIDTKSESQE